MATQQTRAEDKQNQQSKGDEGARMSQANLARRASPVTLVTPMDFFRMNPFSLMRRLTEEMDRVFGDGGQARQANGDIAWAPAIEVSRREGSYVVRAELPGLKPEDVKLEIENGALILLGERKVQREEDREGVRQTEIQYGRFYRTIPLPDGADVEQARANFENGVLEVTVPLPEEKGRRKQIPIQSGSTAKTTTA